MAEPLGMWVYGVVRGDAPDPPRCVGVDARYDVELIRHDGLAAVASAVPLEEFRREALEQRLEDLAFLAALARAHERVLDDTLRLGPVVPLRICTIYESADSVRAMLARQRRALAVALHRLGGSAEWGVKAYRGPTGERARPAQDAAGSSAASGIDYLARKRRARDAAGAALRQVELIHDSLSDRALDAVVIPIHDPALSGDQREMVLNGAYLVPEARTEEFRSLVGSLAGCHAPDGLVLELTGPWPAYHFVGSAAAV
jgi:hypothetical protein